jgi:acyl-coenzyme A thioesterase PaaI-like protein
MVEADVRDENGRLIARASSTCMILRGDMAAGR